MCEVCIELYPIHKRINEEWEEFTSQNKYKFWPYLTVFFPPPSHKLSIYEKAPFFEGVGGRGGCQEQHSALSSTYKNALKWTKNHKKIDLRRNENIDIHILYIYFIWKHSCEGYSSCGHSVLQTSALVQSFTHNEMWLSLSTLHGVTSVPWECL